MRTAPIALAMLALVPRALHTERASQSSVGGARELDDGFDFPPTAHPGRDCSQRASLSF